LGLTHASFTCEEERKKHAQKGTDKRMKNIFCGPKPIYDLSYGSYAHIHHNKTITMEVKNICLNQLIMSLYLLLLLGQFLLIIS
jgi:hypothetical protein